MQPGSSTRAQERGESFIEAARRRQIAHSAIETLAEVGLARASFARIAAHAGVSPSLISYHFASRDDLLRTVAETLNASMDEFLNARARRTRSYAGALRAIIGKLVAFYVSRPVEMRALRALREAGRHADGSVASTLAAEMRERGIVGLETLFREGQRAGEFRRFATRPMAVTLMAALEAVPAELAAHPETDATRYARDLSRTFELATRKEPATAPRPGNRGADQ